MKGSRGLGLSVCGGIDSDSSWPGLLRIKRLFPHQPAAESGLLQVGDLILEANGVAVSGLSNCVSFQINHLYQGWPFLGNESDFLMKICLWMTKMLDT